MLRLQSISVIITGQENKVAPSPAMSLPRHFPFGADKSEETPGTFVLFVRFHFLV
jgi:hypothetical protein